MEGKSLYYPHALIKRIIITFLFSLHADLHVIINLDAWRGILDLL
jgi:hypothetical protein